MVTKTTLTTISDDSDLEEGEVSPLKKPKVEVESGSDMDCSDDIQVDRILPPPPAPPTLVDIPLLSNGSVLPKEEPKTPPNEPAVSTSRFITTTKPNGQQVCLKLLEFDVLGCDEDLITLEMNPKISENVAQSIKRQISSDYDTFTKTWSSSNSNAHSKARTKITTKYIIDHSKVNVELMSARHDEFEKFFDSENYQQYKISSNVLKPTKYAQSEFHNSKDLADFVLKDFKQHFSFGRRLAASKSFLVMHMAFPNLNPMKLLEFPNTVNSELSIWESGAHEKLEGDVLKDELYTIGKVREHVENYTKLSQLFERNDNRLFLTCKDLDLTDDVYRTLKGIWTMRLTYDLYYHLLQGTQLYVLRETKARPQATTAKFNLDHMIDKMKSQWKPVEEGFLSKAQRRKVRRVTTAAKKSTPQKQVVTVSTPKKPAPVQPPVIDVLEIPRKTPEIFRKSRERTPERTRRSPERSRRSPERNRRSPRSDRVLPSRRRRTPEKRKRSAERRSPDRRKRSRSAEKRSKTVEKEPIKPPGLIDPKMIIKPPGLNDPKKLPSLLDPKLDLVQQTRNTRRSEADHNSSANNSNMVVVDTMIDEQGRKILLKSECVQPPSNHINVVTTGITDYIAALDMVSVATNRSHVRVVEHFKHDTTENFVRKISERMGCELLVQTEKDATSPSESSCKTWCHLNGTLVIATMGVGRGPTESVSKAYAFASMLAAFAHLLIIPFEMVRIIQNLGEKYIDSIIYACRKRFAQFALISENAEFSKLALCGWPEGVDAETLQQWSWFIHQMREQGVAHWKSNNYIFLPSELHLRMTPIIYFTFEVSKDEETADWTSLAPTDEERQLAATMPRIDPLPDTRFGVFDFEKGVVGQKYEASQYEPDELELPLAKLSHGGDLETYTWFGMRDMANHEAIMDQFALPDRDYRCLVTYIAKMWNRQLVYKHFVTTEVTDIVGKRHHNISVTFYGIPYMFLGATARHVNPSISLQRAFRSIVAQLMVLRILPMEMFFLRENYGGHWDFSLIYAVRSRFAALENLASKPTFAAMYEHTIATLRPFQSLYLLSKSFALRMQLEGRAYWKTRSVIELPPAVPIPDEPKFMSMYFSFVTNQQAEVNWNEMHGSEPTIDTFDEGELEQEIRAPVPQWEQYIGWEQTVNAYKVFKANKTDFSLSDVICKEYLMQSEKTYLEMTDTINPGTMQMIVTLIRAFVHPMKTDIMVFYQFDSGTWCCRLYVAGPLQTLTNKICYHKLKSKAFHGAMLQLYCFFIKYMIALPKLEEFVIEDTERLHYVVSFTSVMVDSLIGSVSNAVLKGLDIEQALNQVLEGNKTMWLTRRLPLTTALYEKKKELKTFRIIPCARMTMDQMVQFQVAYSNQDINLAQIKDEDTTEELQKKNKNFENLRSSLLHNGLIGAELTPTLAQPPGPKATAPLSARETERQKLKRMLEMEREKLLRLQDAVVNHPPALNMLPNQMSAAPLGFQPVGVAPVGVAPVGVQPVGVRPVGVLPVGVPPVKLPAPGLIPLPIPKPVKVPLKAPEGMKSPPIITISPEPPVELPPREEQQSSSRGTTRSRREDDRHPSSSRREKDCRKDRPPAGSERPEEKKRSPRTSRFDQPAWQPAEPRSDERHTPTQFDSRREEELARIHHPVHPGHHRHQNPRQLPPHHAFEPHDHYQDQVIHPPTHVDPHHQPRHHADTRYVDPRHQEQRRIAPLMSVELPVGLIPHPAAPPGPVIVPRPVSPTVRRLDNPPVKLSRRQAAAERQRIIEYELASHGSNSTAYHDIHVSHILPPSSDRAEKRSRSDRSSPPRRVRSPEEKRRRRRI